MLQAQVGYWETFHLQKSGKAHRCGLPRKERESLSLGVLKERGCGTEGRGQWAQQGGLGLGILEISSNLNNSMLL